MRYQISVLITGATGNLGTLLARHLLQTSNASLRLMIHKRAVAKDLRDNHRVSVFGADLGRVSYYGDTTSMRRELLPRLQYPTIAEGRQILIDET
jgi:short-subunit dehydrogenase